MRRIIDMTTDYECERGSALVMAILVIFAVTAIGSVVAMMASVDMKISSNQRLDTTALFAAEAGLNEAAHRLSLPSPTTATIGGWTGDISITDPLPLDPDWTARIYLTDPGSPPAPTGGDIHTGTLQDLSGDYMSYSKNSGTEDVLTIRHKWDDLNADGIRDANEIVLYDAAKVPPENFATGYPIEVIEITGTAGAGIRRIEAEVTKMPIVIKTLGALYSDKAVRVNGTPAFCGWNHSMTTPVGTVPMGCFAFHLGADHLPGITTTGDVIDLQGGAYDCEGSPTDTNNDPTNPFFSLAEVLGITDDQAEDLLDQAHNTSVVDPLDGITYIQGDVNINSNLVGEGLLYITGDLHANGGFRYTGMIYVEGDLTFNGSPWILGTIIVNGTGDFNFAAGGAELLFSKDAIQMALGAYLPMVRLSWMEQ